LSTFPNLAREVTDSFSYIESVSSLKNLINFFAVLVTDSYPYSETDARTARKMIDTIVAMMDYFAFGDQVGSGGSSNSPGFFTDLGNRLVAGINGLVTGFNGLTGSLTGGSTGSSPGGSTGSSPGGSTGSSTSLSPMVLAFAIIAALAAVIAIFVGRRSGKKGCNVIAMAAPACPKYGGKHKCGGRSGHVESHKCKCGASW